MLNQTRIRDYSIKIGTLATGKRNAITDVIGVKVGHSTISNGDIQTGVTTILPHSGNLFKEKVISSLHTINGYGKTAGSIQIEEMGTIESPIVLTNTLAVGVAMQASIEYSLKNNPEIGRTTGTVNPVVCECNDMLLNDIRNVQVTKQHVYDSINLASEDFLEGNVGAGTGMTSFGLKGGIGSSSRIVSIKDHSFTIGTLVLSNFGKMNQFLLNGKIAGPSLQHHLQNRNNESEKGSIIIIVATDLPVNNRQLKRVIKRSVVGLSKTGSYIGNGSGDIVLGFTTANKVPHEDEAICTQHTVIHDHHLDPVFQAVADSTEEAILNSMITSSTTVGRNGLKIHTLREFMNHLM
jgi:D-aminopeptidase